MVSSLFIYNNTHFDSVIIEVTYERKKIEPPYASLFNQE